MVNFLHSQPASLFALSTSVVILSIHLLTNSAFSFFNFSFSLSTAFNSTSNAIISSCTSSTSFFFSFNSASRSLSLRSRKASCLCTEVNWDVKVVFVVVRVVVVVWRVWSWAAREERAAWVVLRSCRRRQISSLFGEAADVDAGFKETGVVVLRSARRVSWVLLVELMEEERRVDTHRHQCMFYASTRVCRGHREPRGNACSSRPFHIAVCIRTGVDC